MATSNSPFGSVGGSLDPNAKPSEGGKRHQRIPSVILSPSPSNDPLELPPKEIPIDIDIDAISPVLRDEMSLASTYHDTVAKPEFWERLIQFLKYVYSLYLLMASIVILTYGVFCRGEFQTEADLHLAFEDFLVATKGALTAHQIAKIRDHVGFVGMAGT